MKEMGFFSQNKDRGKMIEVTITREYINSLLSTKDHPFSISRDALAMLGCKWPPVKGWRNRYLGKTITVDADELRNQQAIAKRKRESL